MGYLNVRSFIFDGVSSDAYGVGIGWLKSDNKETVNTGLASNVQQGNLNMDRHETHQYGTIYQGNLQFEFGIYKIDGTNFTYEESRRINKWLTGSKVCKKFYFDDENSESIHYYAICTDIVDVVLTGITMKKLTFACNSPFGYDQEITRVFESTATPKEYKILNNSDDGVYYPTIRIDAGASYTDKFTITNVTDDKTMILDFKNVSSISGQKTLILDCKLNKITDVNNSLIPLYKIGWDEPDNIYWLGLTEETNIIRLKGAGKVTMKFEFPRKVGAV